MESMENVECTRGEDHDDMEAKKTDSKYKVNVNTMYCVHVIDAKKQTSLTHALQSKYAHVFLDDSRQIIQSEFPLGRKMWRKVYVIAKNGGNKQNIIIADQFVCPTFLRMNICFEILLCFSKRNSFGQRTILKMMQMNER